jgi:hypothetical protein
MWGGFLYKEEDCVYKYFGKCVSLGKLYEHQGFGFESAGNKAEKAEKAKADLDWIEIKMEAIQRVIDYRLKVKSLTKT